jgi:hypothetical protein
MLKKRYINPNTIVSTIIDSNSPVSGTAFIAIARNIRITASSVMARATRAKRERMSFSPRLNN